MAVEPKVVVNLNDDSTIRLYSDNPKITIVRAYPYFMDAAALAAALNECLNDWRRIRAIIINAAQ